MKASRRSNCPRSTPGMATSELECFLVSGSRDSFIALRARGVPEAHWLDFRAAFMDRNFVLDANSSHAFHVNSGFQSHDIARPNYLFLASSQPRPFVNFMPRPWPVLWTKYDPSPCCIAERAARPGPRSGGYAGAQSLVRSLLRLLDRFIPPANSRRCAPQINGARQIAAVVAEYSTQVQHHQLVFLQSLCRGMRMRQRRARPGGHNDSNDGPLAPFERMR